MLKIKKLQKTFGKYHALSDLKLEVPGDRCLDL